MTDQRIRELERLAQVGDLSAAAAWLAERMRSGELSEERVRLASYLGHEPATTALGQRRPRPFSRLDLWARGVMRWGLEAGLRWALAVSNQMHVRLGRSDHERQVLTAIEGYVVEPPTSQTVLELRDLGGASIYRRVDELAWALYRCHTLTPECYSRCLVALAAEARALGLPEGLIRAEVQAELVPWALGDHDPVRERVEVRDRAPA